MNEQLDRFNDFTERTILPNERFNETKERFNETKERFC